MISPKAALLVLMYLATAAFAEDETQAITATELPSISASTTLGTLFRQARSDYYGGSGSTRYGEDNSPYSRVDSMDHRDNAYYDSRCITCDPNKSAAAAAAASATAAAAAPVSDRELYPGRYRNRGKFDYYDDDYEDRRYRDRYDPYYDRARAPAHDYDRYDPYGRNDLFRPSMYNDRYNDPYERDRYYNRPVDRPLLDRPIDRPVDRPLIDRPVDRPLMERPYDRSYERGNGYDNLDMRYNYDDPRYNDRYVPPGRAAARPFDEYGPPRYDRFNANRNYGRHDSRYDRYDPYDRVGHRRPTAYDDRYDRYGGRAPAPDSRGYYGAGGWQSTGVSDRPAYASAWNYAGGNRDSWREVNRDRDRERDRDRDRDGGYYRPRDYFYDSTAAPGGSRGTSYLFDRPESSTKSDADRDKVTSSPQTQDNNKNYKE